MSTTPLGGTTIIHLTHRENGAPDWRIACMPDVANFATQPHQPNYLRSNDTRAVTCPRCKATAVFQQVRAKER